MLEVEPNGQRDRMATRSGQKRPRDRKKHVANISKPSEIESRLLLNLNRQSQLLTVGIVCHGHREAD